MVKTGQSVDEISKAISRGTSIVEKELGSFQSPKTPEGSKFTSTNKWVEMAASLKKGNVKRERKEDDCEDFEQEEETNESRFTPVETILLEEAVTSSIATSDATLRPIFAPYGPCHVAFIFPNLKEQGIFIRIKSFHTQQKKGELEMTTTNQLVIEVTVKSPTSEALLVALPNLVHHLLCPSSVSIKFHVWFVFSIPFSLFCSLGCSQHKILGR
jgi:hypothetical protein